MKKGREYIGYVEKVIFPNKGRVRIIKEAGDPAEEDSCILDLENMENHIGDGYDTEGDAGKICQVKDVVRGQLIRFRLTKKRNQRAEGLLLKVVKRSPLETEAKCPYFGTCGGCTYANLPYDKQLELKESQVKELLEGIMPDYLDLEKIWEGILKSPKEYEYRNKMEFSFGDASLGGDLELGLHKKGSCYDIVTVKKCRIVDEDFRKILAESLSYFRGKETPYYHKKSHEGYLRHLLVRKAEKTGEILVDLVTSSQLPLDTPCTEVSLLEDYKNALLSLKLDGKIRGILNTVNDSVADTVKNESTKILYGEDCFFEELLGLKFKITPFSFFQTNTLSAELLYSKAREYVLDVKKGSRDKVLFDLYSGTGTIAQILSGTADKVVGVEIVEEAVVAARENAEINSLHNIEFITGDVLKVLDEIEIKPDFIILDPPRDGIHPKAIKKIIDYGVDNILYISCKPTSLARDLEIFISKGYEPVRICAIDQFPGTVHVETVCLLTRE
ncbi:MAG: 23S rRNA (uracil(1939)-C(5))-methyltransferase RlmD [Lachnospiraceae bacterium]|nr:23S rRNA (uracil(1939)-C(5))-methyltransferase RlmD [Lachnospiraceae bacterium]